MILLEITEPLVKEIIENSYHVSPYNALGYGMTVALLITIAIKLYYDLKREREYIVKLNQEVLSITNKYIENSVRFEMAISKTAENKQQLEQLIEAQRELMNQIRELKLIIQSKY